MSSTPLEAGDAGLEQQKVLLTCILQELQLQQACRPPEALDLSASNVGAFKQGGSVPPALSPAETRSPSAASSTLVSPVSRSSKASSLEPQTALSSTSPRPIQLESLLPGPASPATDLVSPLMAWRRLPPGFDALPIGLRPPPGLDLPTGIAATAMAAGSELRNGANNDELKPMEEQSTKVEANYHNGPLSVSTSRLNGVTSWRMLWRITNPGSKFKGGCGCALVSPSFSACCLSDLRLMFAPGAQWTVEKARKTKKGKKEKKERKPAVHAPPNGSLQLKFGGDTSAAADVQLYFTVGSMRMGPITASPKQCTSKICEIPSDWRREVSDAENTISVGVEVVYS